MKEKYNGWTNYPTWDVSLYLTNEESSEKYWTETAKTLKEKDPEGWKYTLAEALQELHEAIMEVNIETYPSWMKDIMRYAFEKINFLEIAESLLED